MRNLPPNTRLRAEEGPLYTGSFDVSGLYVLTAGQGKGITLFNSQTGSHLSTYTGHSASIHDLALSSSGNFLSGGADRSLLYWDAARQCVLRRWGGHNGTVNSVAWAGENESIALSASYDRGVRLWDVRSPEKTPMQTLLEAQDSVSEVRARGSLIMATSIDGHVRQYDVRRGKILVDRFREPVVSACYTLDQQAYLCSSLDSILHLVDASTGTSLNQYLGHQTSQYQMRPTLLTNDAQVASGSETGELFIWDILSARILDRWQLHKAGISCVTWHEASGRLLTCSMDGSCTIIKV